MINLIKDIYRNNPGKFKGVLILDILSSLTAGVGIVMLIPITNIMDISSDSAIIPGFIVGILNHIPKSIQICSLLVIYVLLVTLKAIITRTLTVWNSELVQGYTASLRTKFYRAISHAQWEKFISYKRSDLLDSFVTESSKISFAATLLVKLISLFISTIINLCIAMIMSIPLTAVVVLFGGIFCIVFRPVMKRSKEYGSQLRQSSVCFMNEITNQMNGIKEIRSYGIENEQSAIFNQSVNNFRNKNIDYAKLAAAPQMLMSIGAAVMIAGLFFLATQILSVELGKMAVLIYIFGRLWPNLSSAQNYIQTLVSTEPVHQHLVNIISDLSQVTDDSDKKTSEEINFSDSISFNNVSFRYADTDKYILKDISCQIRYGEITAFSGRSGAGKSTLVDLLLGFLHASSGTICIDGKPLVADNSLLWHNFISYIPQDPILLNSSVRENLIRFHPEASEYDMVNALKKSLAWGFVEKFPDGIDTVIGERGIRLSGGERQRIILARALLGNPKLLILDEATSALDYESEKIIADSIHSLRGKMSVIIVAHRLSSIQIADRVIVIENGKITENGTYHELASNSDGYLGKMIQIEEKD